MKSTKPEWRKTSVQGLYEYWPAGISEDERGTYYSRYCVNGQRTFRSLGTTLWDLAKLKHAQRQPGIEKDRQRGGRLGSEFRTVGALLGEAQKRMGEASQKKMTVASWEGMAERLKTYWRRGCFDTFLARNVTADLIVELRDYLHKKAPWKKRMNRVGVGYGPGVVNQSLWLLNVMLCIAQEKMVILENPFSAVTALRKGLLLPVPNASSDPGECRRLRRLLVVRALENRSAMAARSGGGHLGCSDRCDGGIQDRDSVVENVRTRAAQIIVLLPLKLPHRLRRPAMDNLSTDDAG